MRKIFKTKNLLQKKFYNIKKYQVYEKETADHVCHNFDLDTSKPSVLDNW